jgi:hypothetical protein
MALTSLTPAELLSARATDFLANSFLTEAPMFGLLANRVINQKQKAIEWNAKAAQSVVGGRARTAALGNDNSAIVIGASLSIPDYYFKHQFQVGKDEIVNAASTGKTSAVADPVQTELEDAFDVLVRKINAVLFTGTGVADATHFGVVGLNTIVGSNPASGTYAGINRATYTRWRCTRTQGTTPGTPAALTEARIDTILSTRRNNGATYRGNQKGDLVIVTSDPIERTVLRGLYGSIVDNQNIDFTTMSKDLQPYTKYLVQGIPVISDVDCPANTAYLMDLRRFALYSFDQSDADTNNGKIQYIPLRYTDTTGDTPSESTLWVRLADVSDEHPDLLSFELSVACQLVCFDPIIGLSKMEDIANTL